jgi:hypothetical protein
MSSSNLSVDAENEVKDIKNEMVDYSSFFKGNKVYKLS